MRTLTCDNCGVSYNVHDDCRIVRCPGCRCEVEAIPGTPPTDASTRERLGILTLLTFLFVASVASASDTYYDPVAKQFWTLDDAGNVQTVTAPGATVILDRTLTPGQYDLPLFGSASVTQVIPAGAYTVTFTPMEGKKAAACPPNCPNGTCDFQGQCGNASCACAAQVYRDPASGRRWRMTSATSYEFLPTLVYESGGCANGSCGVASYQGAGGCANGSCGASRAGLFRRR
jgi:hypothetical protein